MKDSSHADLLNNEAVRLQGQGRSRESLETFQKAVEEYRANGDLKGEGRCLNGVGALFKDLGEPLKAYHLEQALLLRRQTGDRLGEAITLTTIGPVYLQLGRPKLARDCLVQALRMTRELGHRAREGEALFNLAVVAKAAGQLEQAYAWFQDTLAIAREQGNLIESNKCLTALAGLCGQLGKKQEALSYCSESLRLAEAMSNPRGQSTALHNIGMLLMGTDQEGVGRAYLERSVAIDLETDVPGQAALTMTCLASAYINHDLDRACELANRSIAIAKEIGDEGLMSGALDSLGAVLIERREPRAALEVLDEALQLARRTGERSSEGAVCYTMGRALDLAGDYQAAFTKFREAIAIFEEHYSELDSRDFRLSYFNSSYIQNTYLVYAASLLRYSQNMGDKSYGVQAFEICERRHARALREFLRAKLAGKTDDGTGPPCEESDVGYQEDRRSQARLKLINPPTLAELQRGVLDADTALLEYSLHKAVSYLWVLTRDDHTFVSLPLGGEDIRERVYKLRQALSAGSESYLQLAHELYVILIQPVESWLDGKKNLLIVPDEALHVLPFQVLLSELPNSFDVRTTAHEGKATPSSGLLDRILGRTSPSDRELPYLIRKHAITYAPSAKIFEVLGTAHAREGSLQRELIAFAPVEFAGEDKGGQRLSTLPGTIREVRNIAALFKSEQAVVKTFDLATKHAVLSERLSDFRFVHFATHAFSNGVDSDDSAIFLHGDMKTDRALRSAEIANLELDADLVVLSACETALGKVTYGEGVLGLVRAFICAGAQSACASLWKVDDTATSILMSRFYQNLVTNGLSKTEALRASQLDLIRSNRWSSPRFWAPFVLVGGWR